jgi:hypothetical protein
MTFDWICVDCGASGEVVHRGLPVTSLVNQASFQHVDKSPDCETAKAAEVRLKPAGCVFSKEARTHEA